MPALRSILLLGLSAASICRAHPHVLAEPAAADETGCESAGVDEWQDIVDSLPGDSLQAAVGGHLRPKYREGIFSNGHDAIEAVRSNDPELATKLVDLAKHDAEIKEYLRRRQDAGNTTAVSSASSEAVAPVSSSSSITSAPAVIVTPASSSSQGQSSPSTPAPESSPSLERPSPTPAPTPIPAPVPTSGDSTPPASSSSSSGPSPVPVPVPTSQSSSALDAPQPSSSVIAPQSTHSLVDPVPHSAGSSTITGVLVPVEISTTVGGGSVAVETTQAFETKAPTTIAVAITSTNQQGQVITTSSMAPAILVTSTNAAGSQVVTAAPISNVAVAPGGSVVGDTSVPSLFTTTDSTGGTFVLTRPTSGGVYTAMDNHGGVVVVTYVPGGGVVSQLELKTSTLPNGQVATLTQFAEVGGATDTASASPAPSGSASGTAHLQNGADRVSGSSWFAAESAIVLGMAIGMAGVLL